MHDYQALIESKRMAFQPCGFSIDESALHPALYDFQRAIVRWALGRGRAAIWADCGMGKTLMQLEWARKINGRCLILAPLAVARQTVEEAKKINMEIPYARNPAEMGSGVIAITNYERLDAFDDEPLDAVVLDESSILKSFDGATRKKLIERFAEVPYRLACTATPAPNDFLELGNHAQFLGIMSWQEMAAMFFVHDQQAKGGNRGDMTGAWRLKGHAEDDFWKWLVTWGIFIKRPSDIGFDDNRFKLPRLSIEQLIVKTDVKPDGFLFAAGLHGIQERASVRKGTTDDRVARAAELINSNSEQWIAWCGLNDEADKLAAAVPGAVNVEGSDDAEFKADRLMAFARGEFRVLVSKPKVSGFGMNFQNCRNMVFVGLSDSYESYYQCIRRCHRYGQKRPVNAWIVVSELEEGIVSNVKRKEYDADRMSEEMVKRMGDLERQEIKGSAREEMKYERDLAEGEGWKLHLGDCVEVMRDSIADESVDFSVYSPPFASLYTYSNSAHDMGNCRDFETFFFQFEYAVAQLLRVTKAGRITACHVAQLAAMQSRDGYIGLKDFRGRVIHAFIDAGWIHHGEIVIDKNPQAQAIRTKTKGLMFVQLRKDSTWMRPALADFLLLFRKPGENAVPVSPDISNEDWIKWAHPVWYDIRETETLTAAEGRDEKDEKHICPLQLDVIDRAICLYTNPGEVVLSPFAGIGSEGYQAILRGRRFIGAELKRSYWRAACNNLKAAHTKANEGNLFKTTT